MIGALSRADPCDHAPMHRWTLALVLALVVALSGRPAAACSCGRFTPLIEAVERADAVFVARLVAVSLPTAAERPAIVDSQFVVTRVLKGDAEVGAEVHVLSEPNGSSCDGGIFSRIGETWLLLLAADDEGRFSGLGACTQHRTRSPDDDLLRRVADKIAEEGPPAVRRTGCRVAREPDAGLFVGAWAVLLARTRRAKRRNRTAIEAEFG